MSKKTALITGGSRGIGAATAARFAAAGWDTVFTYVSNREAADAVTAETGARAIQSDVGSEDDIMALMTTLDGDGIYIDALVNNAGITGPKRRMEDVGDEHVRVRRVIDRRRRDAPERVREHPFVVDLLTVHV